ncbi:hypothetical protein VTK73DRAFT_4746 [Phialemonium thermophilum]|uniref:STAS domain-containing protein n=1 Tax=Phialemonium thermophilum TaxID=223376 RepID=A0ABR3WS54_9PEZI
MATSLPRRVDRLFGIKDDENPRVEPNSEPGDGIYLEAEPTTLEFFQEHLPTADSVRSYIRSLLPFLGWITHYNLTWLLGDLVAGITVGFVVVPQGMAYALLANLPPEFGLYTSFVGFFLYWAFATSKDITIGTVAVMSTIVGKVIIRVQEERPDLAADAIARGLALICGAVLLFIGLIRFGFIVEFIPLTAIASFMTGAALNIASGQVPNLMGIKGVNTRAATYKVIIDTLKGLPTTRLDAAMGLTALFALYFIRWFCGFMARRHPKNQKLWFFISTLRMAVIMILYILVSWLANRHVKKASNAKFKILGTVPSGFRHAGAPKIDNDLLKAIAPDLPVSIIVLIIEHIAISKSFGRVNNYIINPSQELVAIGFTNLLGPFLGGYPATGSFSRTAIKSKAGVRTPLAGIFTAVVVLLALYALTSVFFYIPSASLSALIIHAVGDLITPPKQVFQYWRVSPIEVIIFFAGVLLSVFTNIENGIYLTVAATAALLLFRIAKTKGRFLGEIKVHSVPRSTLRGGTESVVLPSDASSRDVFVALDNSDGSNKEIRVDQPYPGVFVYRFSDGFNYVNSAYHLDYLTLYIYSKTRRTELDKFAKLGDRPWNDPGPRRGQAAYSEELAARPLLRAVVLDLSAVNYIDVTSAQALIDLRDQFNRYAAPNKVEWHFAGVSNRWTKRALVASGFGYSDGSGHNVGLASFSEDEEKATTDPKDDPLIAVTVVESGVTQATSSVNVSGEETEESKAIGAAEESISPIATAQTASTNPRQSSGGRVVPVYGVNRPYFHVDLATAVESAIRNASGNA